MKPCGRYAPLHVVNKEVRSPVEANASPRIVKTPQWCWLLDAESLISGGRRPTTKSITAAAAFKSCVGTVAFELHGIVSFTARETAVVPSLTSLL